MCHMGFFRYRTKRKLACLPAHMRTLLLPAHTLPHTCRLHDTLVCLGVMLSPLLPLVSGLVLVLNNPTCASCPNHHPRTRTMGTVRKHLYAVIDIENQSTTVSQLNSQRSSANLHSLCLYSRVTILPTCLTISQTLRHTYASMCLPT
jgi:hypothetical protein